jgi:hypothetical protein
MSTVFFVLSSTNELGENRLDSSAFGTLEKTVTGIVLALNMAMCGGLLWRFGKRLYKQIVLFRKLKRMLGAFQVESAHIQPGTDCQNFHIDVEMDPDLEATVSSFVCPTRTGRIVPVNVAEHKDEIINNDITERSMLAGKRETEPWAPGAPHTAKVPLRVGNEDVNDTKAPRLMEESGTTQGTEVLVLPFEDEENQPCALVHLSGNEPAETSSKRSRRRQKNKKTNKKRKKKKKKVGVAGGT